MVGNSHLSRKGGGGLWAGLRTGGGIWALPVVSMTTCMCGVPQLGWRKPASTARRRRRRSRKTCADATATEPSWHKCGTTQQYWRKTATSTPADNRHNNDGQPYRHSGLSVVERQAPLTRQWRKAKLPQLGPEARLTHCGRSGF